VKVGGDVDCNPITNEGCDGSAGEACDYNAGAYACYPKPNDLGLCDACGGEDGFCGPGLTCYQRITIGTDGLTVTGKCARSCCDDGDCGGGTCGSKATVGGTSVGVCLDAPGGGA
jgi:hypothetical protein